MSDESTDRTLSDDEIERMVATVEPDWTVEDAALADDGHTSVYHLTVDAGDGRREAILKATPEPGEDYGIGTEARLMAIVADRTGVPVPDVFGVVDDHDALQAPFFLMESVPGTDFSFLDVRTLSDDVLERTARETGAYLAELHGLDAVDGFGQVSIETGTLAGERPPTTLDALTVSDPADSWPALFETWVDDHLDPLTDSRFSDLVGPLQATLSREAATLDGPFSPALGRIDHGLHNLMLDGTTGEITALLDWAFTLAVPPTYDLVLVEWVLSGQVLAALPAAPDREALVRDAICDGYRDVAGSLPDSYHDHQPIYQLLSRVLSMTHVDAGVASIPEGTEDTVAQGLRGDVERRLDTA